MKIKIMIAALWLCVMHTYAQNPFPKSEHAEKVFKRKLAVELFSDAVVNNELQEVFKDSWNISQVVFLSGNEIIQLKKQKSNDYVFLTHQDEVKQDMRYRTSKAEPGNTHGYTTGYQYRSISRVSYVAFSFAYYNFRMSLFDGKKEIDVTNIGFPNGELVKYDFLYLCQQLHNLVSASAKGTPPYGFYSVDSNIVKCQKYTLVLLKDFFKAEDQEKMSTFYQYKYKLVDGDEYEKIILNKEPEMGYVKIIWSNQHSLYMWIVVDAKDGSVLSQVGFGGVRFGSSHVANDIIKAKHLKYIYSKSGQNLNSRYY